MEKKYVWGTINGKKVYSRDEFIFTRRGFGAINNDVDLLTFASKVTCGWSERNFNTEKKLSNFYLSDYCDSEPFASLTKDEFNRLCEIQKSIKAYEEHLEVLRDWRKVDTIYYADNSVEEIWEDKDGNRENRMVVAPHGDAC